MYALLYKKFIWAGAALIFILMLGTAGYRLIGGPEYSLLDSFYMTVITISTIGFGEIIDMSASPAGRVFTIFMAFSGVGILFYLITNFTAYVVEGELKESFRRKKMEKMAKNYSDHYIVCGIGRVGFHIANELSATGRPFVVVDIDRNNLDKFSDAFPDRVYIESDATDNDTLLIAGVERASGIFAVTGDDNQNLVISLTAKDINPGAKVIARCNDIRHSDKIKKAGADAVVSPNFIGGLRMASEMIRPSVVSFLDTMLRDTGKNLRVEEAGIPDAFAGRTISDLNLKEYPGVLLLAVRTGAEWIYNPPDDHSLKANDSLVFMTTPEERKKIEKMINAG
jgi:voltage-gated potassium channel